MVAAAAVRQVWAALTWSKAALILGDLVPLLLPRCARAPPYVYLYTY